MAELLNAVTQTCPIYKPRPYAFPTNSHQLKKIQSVTRKNSSTLHQFHGVQCLLQGGSEVEKRTDSSAEYSNANWCDEGESEHFPHVQTLRNFPQEELDGRVVMVRFDSSILLRKELDQSSPMLSKSILTIKYLYESRAKVILVGGWRETHDPGIYDMESVADILSSVLQYEVVAVECVSCNTLLNMEVFNNANIFLLQNLSEFKEEVTNDSNFAKRLSSGVDIFVNDSFSVSHKILASTVGVARFCTVCVAGFHFEESLRQLKKVVDTNKSPYFAIIGGSNLWRKATALQFLASRCEGLIFVGMMSFQIMHALGYSVPSNFLETRAQKAALDIIQTAGDRNVQIFYPKDFCCVNKQVPGRMEIVHAHSFLDGWLPVDLGPSSIDKINSLLTTCKKILWIGPVNFKFSSQLTTGASKLAQRLDELLRRNRDITVVGNVACEALMTGSSSTLPYDIVEDASVAWEFFKQRKLPGIMALDRNIAVALLNPPSLKGSKALKFLQLHVMLLNIAHFVHRAGLSICAAYSDPTKPLVVDIGCGNGLFLLKMASRRKDFNFLGLEINKKLVRRCMDSVHQSSIQNGYFIATNATSTFRTIVSSYPGELVLASIQCPDPDFRNPEHRWRILQRSLVEAVVDMLAEDGKVFLQSDIEAVAVRMKELFLKYSKGKLTLSNGPGVWLEENPFGATSDWEQHVIDRGDPMYRLIFSK